MKKDIVEIFARAFSESRNEEIQKVTEFLKDDISENGTRIYMDGEEMHFKKIKFQTDGDTIDKEYLVAENSELDFSSIDDDELWSYIYGEYILNGELGKIQGFGLTQVETY